jgi:hypothetical protein
MNDDLVGAIHCPMLDRMAGITGMTLFTQSSLANH